MTPTKLITAPNIADPDGFYEQLISLYQDQSDEQNQHISSTLILLLANHIGDIDVLNEAFAIATAQTQDSNN